MASEDEDIDKLKLPAAVKLAKEKNISISGLKDLEEIKWELKKHLLAGCRKRDDVNHLINKMLFYTLQKLIRNLFHL
jgi:hypothetical protein